MSKEEFYKKFIDIQKTSGQGLSGIVKIMGPDADLMSLYLDEFIEEGLVVACDMGSPIGHPETNIWYMPTKGYNVWEDSEGDFLTCVRFYLGALESESDDEKESLARVLNPTMQDCRQNLKFMQEYAKWLKRNEKALEEMKNLDDFYSPSVVTDFTKEEAAWVKERGWYKENKTVEACLKASLEAVEEGTDQERIKVNEQLIPLYKRSIELGQKEYIPQLAEAEKDIASSTKGIYTRKKLNKWLAEQPKKEKIQTVFNYAHV